MLPNFIVIGAAKCGTTSVCELLGEHPTVFMSDPKEPCFFSHMDEDLRTRDWYESLFENVTAETAIGEGSTAYTHPEVIETTSSRIKDLIPDCRLIYMVRHPLKRLESDWRMRRHEKWTPESISEAVVEQPTLVSHSFYWKNLSVYRKKFADEQILVVFLEDFKRDPDRELSRCFSHIGVDPTIPIADSARPRNTAAGFRKDSPVASAIRRLRVFEELKAAMPTWLVDTGKRLLTRQESFDLIWEPVGLREVVGQLAEDAGQFLAYCEKPATFWDLQTPSV